MLLKILSTKDLCVWASMTGSSCISFQETRKKSFIILLRCILWTFRKMHRLVIPNRWLLHHEWCWRTSLETKIWVSCYSLFEHCKWGERLAAWYCLQKISLHSGQSHHDSGHCAGISFISCIDKTSIIALWMFYQYKPLIDIGIDVFKKCLFIITVEDFCCC